jgi:hypothetical protein
MSELFNIRLTLLYKETELKYANDDEVDSDDTYFLCDELYRHELLQAFCLTIEELDFLSNKVEQLFEVVKKEPEIMSLIELNRFIEDDFTTFMTLFSYEHFYIIYPIIVRLLE